MALALAGCQTTPQITYDKHTNQKVAYSSLSHPYSGLFDWLQAKAFYSDKHGYGIETLYSNYGWIFPAEVWSFGKKFQYVKTSAQTAMCGGAGGCITLEGGLILMSEADFQAAAKNGFEFRLVGSAGSVVGKIPAKHFQEVLSLRNSQ